MHILVEYEHGTKEYELSIFLTYLYIRCIHNITQFFLTRSPDYSIHYHTPIDQYYSSHF